jgi:hypothetical protein
MFEPLRVDAPPLQRAIAADFALLREALGRISAAVDAGLEWSDEARCDVLAQLDRIGGMTATARGRWLRAVREAETVQGPGDPSFEAALSRRSRSGVGAAKREVRQAEALGAMDDLAGAVDDGAVPVGHLDPVARALASASPEVRALLTSPRMQQRLIDLARRLDAPAFARRVAAIVAEASPGRLQRDHDTQRRSRYLRLSDGPDGTRVSGLLDRISGHTLRLALEATGNRPGAEREPEQACADALVDLANAVLGSPETAPGASVRPHVSLILREETLAALRRHETEVAAREAAERGARRRTGERSAAGSRSGASSSVRPDGEERAVGGDGGLAAGLDDCSAFPAATLEDGTVVPASETARILCDCEVTRIAMSAEGVPLDLGRTKRLYTGSHRRAVIARDRGCAWPGCERHVRWTEIHHIRWWDRDGGETSIENAAALCSFHHHVVHARDLTLERVLDSAGRDRDADPGRAGPPSAAGPPEYVVRDSRWRIVAEPRRLAVLPDARQDSPARTDPGGEGSGAAAARAASGAVNRWGEPALFEEMSA